MGMRMLGVLIGLIIITCFNGDLLGGALMALLATVIHGYMDPIELLGTWLGSEFTVQLKAGWTIRFINVPGNSTWEFEEVNIPAGYTLDTTKTIGMTGIAYVNTANNCSITNTQTSSDVTFKKKDFTTKAFVPGAVFELQRLVNGMYVKVDDVDGLTSDSTFTITSEAGVTLTLAPGSYKLIEKTSPDGYIIMTDEILFTVGDRLAITSETDLAEIDASDPTVMNLFNKVGQPLPNTGGPGNYLNYLGGIALLMTAAVMYGFRMRRRERRYN